MVLLSLKLSWYLGRIYARCCCLLAFMIERLLRMSFAQADIMDDETIFGQQPNAEDMKAKLPVQTCSLPSCTILVHVFRTHDTIY